MGPRLCTQALSSAAMGTLLPFTNQVVPTFQGGGRGNCQLPSPGQGSWPHLGWQDSGLVTEMSLDLLPFSRAGRYRVRVVTSRRAQSRLGGPLPSAHPASNPTSPFP